MTPAVQPGAGEVAADGSRRHLPGLRISADFRGRLHTARLKFKTSHRRKRFLLSLLGLLLAALGCAPAGRHPLVVGMELNYPPFEMVDARGQPTGVSVDLAKALGQYLQREARIENIPFDGLTPALKTGKIDLIISSMTATPERAQSIAFSESYLRTGLCLLANRRANLVGPDDLVQDILRCETIGSLCLR